MELFERRFGRFRLEPDRNDGRLRGKIFQMRVEHPEKRFDVVRRLGNFEPVRVTALVAENNFELKLTRDKMKRAEPHGKLLEKPLQHEEKRLARFDFVFELECFLERFPDRNELEQPHPFFGGAFPKLNSDRPEPSRDRFLLERGELA